MLAGYKLLEKKDLNLSWTMQLNFTLCIPSGNFDGQLSTIIPALPENRQTLLFTATNSSNVATVLSICKNNPHTWELPIMEEKHRRWGWGGVFSVAQHEASEGAKFKPCSIQVGPD